MARANQRQDPHLVETGAMLARRRAQLGMTIKGMAERSGIPKTTVADIEAGWTDPSFSTMVLLARHYRIRLEELAVPTLEAFPS